MTRLIVLLSSFALVLVLLAPGGPAASQTPRAAGPERLALLIRGGCPYNLDKVCHRNRHGRMVCHCAS